MVACALFPAYVCMFCDLPAMYSSDQTDSGVAPLPDDKPLNNEDGSGAAAPADDIPESEDVSLPLV